jgi:HAMP domain-containing protein
MGGGEADVGCEREDDPAPARLIATFATPRERFDELESVQEFAAAYDEFARAHREQYLDRTYRNVFAVLLGLTIVLAVAAGIFVARPVTKGIARLAAATRPVAEGDLSVRVAEEGDDEVADLGRAFNRMLGELGSTRAPPLSPGCIKKGRSAPASALRLDAGGVPRTPPSLPRPQVRACGVPRRPGRPPP